MRLPDRFFHGQNSPIFQLASHVSLTLGHALSVAEMCRNMETTIQVALGDPLSYYAAGLFQKEARLARSSAGVYLQTLSSAGRWRSQSKKRGCVRINQANASWEVAFPAGAYWSASSGGENNMTATTLGPVGGLGGREFADYAIPEGAKISRIDIYAERFVNALQLYYITPMGKQVELPRIGGKGGELTVIELNADEYVTGISGRYGWFVDALCIHTTKRTSVSCGGGGGEEAFELLAPAGEQVTGLLGRSDWFIDALGIVSGPLPKKSAPKKKPAAAKKKAASKKKAPAKKAAGAPDPKGLQKVEGIGPKIASLLIEAGIPDLAALSKSSVKKIQQVLDAAGSRYRIADPTTWPQQAKLGAKGDWDGLKALQAELKGGRKVT